MDYAALVQKHGSINKAAIAVNLAPSTFRDRLYGGRPGLKKQAKGALPMVVATPAVQGRSIAAFRAEFDKATVIPAKIRAALKQLGSGWLFETEFAQAAGVNLNDLGHFRDQFAEHVLVARSPGRSERRIWAGTAAAAAQMRAML
jgi:hypothetical protein